MKTRFAFLVFCMFVLTQCGFRQLYGPDGLSSETREELSSIDVIVPEDRPGFILKRALTDVLSGGQIAAFPEYELVIQLEQQRTSLAIQLDSTITRRNLTTTTDFFIRKTGEEDSLYSSSIRRVGSFNVRSEPYATLVSERDVEQRNLEEVAREIRLKLATWFANNRAGAS